MVVYSTKASKFVELLERLMEGQPCCVWRCQGKEGFIGFALARVCFSGDINGTHNNQSNLTCDFARWFLKCKILIGCSGQHILKVYHTFYHPPFFFHFFFANLNLLCNALFIQTLANRSLNGHCIYFQYGYKCKNYWPLSLKKHLK